MLPRVVSLLACPADTKDSSWTDHSPVIMSKQHLYPPSQLPCKSCYHSSSRQMSEEVLLTLVGALRPQCQISVLCHLHDLVFLLEPEPVYQKQEKRDTAQDTCSHQSPDC